MTEIERKFLVRNDDFKEMADQKKLLVQAYLNTNPERTIRIRIDDDRAYLTIKGKSTKDGLSRFEWEKEIDLNEAKELLKLCEPGKIEKYRYHIQVEGHTYEVDEFLGDNEGLTIAEVELEHEEELFEKPYWLGKEVTGDTRYFNSNILTNPFKNWK